jgi:hypothetical protein
MGEYPNPGQGQPDNSSTCRILMTSEDIHIQTHIRQYCMPIDSNPTMSNATQLLGRTPLMILCPSGDPTSHIPRAPL